jgi:hypothetical protein
MNWFIRVTRCSFIITLIFFFSTLSCLASVVLTKHGPREGKVIVRESSDQVVITIKTPQNRLFQFYEKDVIKVTAKNKNLLSKNTWLMEKPDDQSKSDLLLSKGLEVQIIDIQTRPEGWVFIKIWGNKEGWIPESVLTDQVEFTPQEVNYPKGSLFKTQHTGTETAETSPSIPVKTPQDK